MRHILCLLWLVSPMLILAREHRVPIGSEGNLLVLSVHNDTQSTFEGVQVRVYSAPEWLVFNISSVRLGAIPAKRHIEAKFEFRVPETQTEQTDSVRFVISDDRGRFLGQRMLKFHAFLLPKTTRLDSPYPNPANPEATIRYELHTPAHVKLEVYNILGQRVKRLLDSHRPAGTFSVVWDGTDESGRPVASGNYVVQMTTTGIETKVTKQYYTKVLIQK